MVSGTPQQSETSPNSLSPALSTLECPQSGHRRSGETCSDGHWAWAQFKMSPLPYNLSLCSHSAPSPTPPLCNLHIRLIKPVPGEVAFHVQTVSCVALVTCQGSLIEGKETRDHPRGGFEMEVGRPRGSLRQRELPLMTPAHWLCMSPFFLVSHLSPFTLLRHSP